MNDGLASFEQISAIRCSYFYTQHQKHLHGKCNTNVSKTNLSNECALIYNHLVMHVCVYIVDEVVVFTVALFIINSNFLFGYSQLG